ncbi:Clr6 histone deacetylase associated PHD protein- 1 Cph1 [Schizosaccharomyces japonicus yFS275]|uniref:Clr6 histone deacetylase associated PHD protein-1 Cph1 n=1 Tax=Schizosaccharomyces japonicus (strain yFS275 / FY16936) TaxID=402676 RepID=B6K5B4_SCHJY|nr:Clr6 histone deacetylase associated PHD protein- 1 Cph1 [Schizosaccharomyces japonicus yFS275]EEB08718.1 Clr6 histone deacetylase associated PHD protein- 1 Cph1 [Schizosaccharomyces japonicus yFS275]
MKSPKKPSAPKSLTSSRTSSPAPAGTPNSTPAKKSKSRTGTETSDQTTSAPKRRRRRKPVIQNEDFCGACGGQGLFLCCESCPRSFHLSCLNPPLSRNDIPEGSWYCNKCMYKKNETPKRPRGMWSLLMDDQDDSNPVCFKLPQQIVTEFHGITVGRLGQYKEENTTLDYGEIAELLSDQSMMNLAHCGHCHRPSIGSCKITGCDLCETFYHTGDCAEYMPVCEHPDSAKQIWRIPRYTVAIKDSEKGTWFLEKQKFTDDPSSPEDEYEDPPLPVSCIYNLDAVAIVQDFLINAKRDAVQRRKTQHLERLPTEPRALMIWAMQKFSNNSKLPRVI